MNFQDVLKLQRMTRRFDGRPVERSVLESVLAHARKSPSAGFSQGFAFVVLEGGQRDMFFELTKGGVDATFSNAQVVILPLADKQAYLERYSQPDKEGIGFDREENWPAPYWYIDAAFATMIVMLSATAVGLGVWFFAIVRGEEETLRTLGVPDRFKAIGALALGYPEDSSEDSSPGALLKKRRKPPEEMIHWGRW